MSGDRLYLVTACRWGESDTHHYTVGLFTTLALAEQAAEHEAQWRAGKYECRIDAVEAHDTLPTTPVQLGEEWEDDALDATVEAVKATSKEELRRAVVAVNAALNAEITELRERGRDLLGQFRFTGVTMEGPDRQRDAILYGHGHAARVAYWRFSDLLGSEFVPDPDVAALRSKLKREALNVTQSHNIRPELTGLGEAVWALLRKEGWG